MAGEICGSDSVKIQFPVQENEIAAKQKRQDLDSRILPVSPKPKSSRLYFPVVNGVPMRWFVRREME